MLSYIKRDKIYYNEHTDNKLKLVHLGYRTKTDNFSSEWQNCTVDEFWTEEVRLHTPQQNLCILSFKKMLPLLCPLRTGISDTVFLRPNNPTKMSFILGLNGGLVSRFVPALLLPIRPIKLS